MNKQTIITILFALVAMAGQAQTPKDSCSIPKDSLCQERIAKSDTVNCPLDKLFLLKANVTNKEESKRNLPKIALPKNDIYREKFMNLQLINIIGSHLSRWEAVFLLNTTILNCWVLFYESICYISSGIQTSWHSDLVRCRCDGTGWCGPSESRWHFLAIINKNLPFVLYKRI